MGQIQIVDVGNNHHSGTNIKPTINIIKAHKLNIRCLCLNRTGTLIASASITGTIIRIHSTRTTALLYEFRRGIDRAIITSMKFSHDDSKLAVLSDKHTLHVYNIDETQYPNDGGSGGTKDGGGGGRGLKNRHHLLNGLLPYLPNYFQSTWSFVLLIPINIILPIWKIICNNNNNNNGLRMVQEEEEELMKESLDGVVMIV